MSKQTRDTSDVLAVHVMQFDRTIGWDGEPGTYCDHCGVGPYPCGPAQDAYFESRPRPERLNKEAR